MSVEPGIVDTNVLVYALDADAPQHIAARALLDAARDASSTLFVTSQILCEFYSIVTNPQRVSKPRAASDALSAASGLLAFLRVLPIPLHAVDGLLELLRHYPVTAAKYSTCKSWQPCRRMRSREFIRSTPLTSRFFRNSRL